MQIIKEKTQSLCSICYSRIPAMVYEQNGQVYINKRCFQHGEFNCLVEKDVDFYRRFAHINYEKRIEFDRLVIPITYRCNLDCSYCYTPFIKRKDIALNEIEEAVENFSGKEICLSGGEPTLREDLISIIAIVRKLGKRAFLVTNGLRLSDRDYVCDLKRAGLNAILFSLDSLNEDFYVGIKKSKNHFINILDLKKKALINLEMEKIWTTIGVTIYPGINDKEIKDLFIFALHKNHFIFQLRLRSCVMVGRADNKIQDGYFLSELVNLFAKQTDIDKAILIDKCLTSEYHTPHHVEFSLEGYLKDENFIPFPQSKKVITYKLLSFLPYLKRCETLREMSFLSPYHRKLRVRVIRWPKIDNIDLQEVDRGIGCLYNNKEVLNFCHAIILDNKSEE